MNSNNVLIVIFGATGDLAKRKLFPALYSLVRGGAMQQQFSVVGVGRANLQDPEFKQHIRSSIDTYSRYKVNNETEWNEFADRFHYCKLDASHPEEYASLKNLLDKVDKSRTLGNRLFYLAMAPEFFGIVAQNIKSAGLRTETGWNRLIIEKPFGHDLESAKSLNAQIHEAFTEEETFRIDHYLGKEMIQNIEVIRFANSMFEPLWNNRHIDNVQITLSETVGVEERAGYYERAGALRDMVQNHILQVVMMVAMEPPSRFATEAIRDEKVKVLRSIRKYSPEDVKQRVVRGQYGPGELNGKDLPGYRQEPGVDPNSNTETYVAATIYVDNFRWSGVPFYVRTGKRMPAKATEIVIEFKGMPDPNYLNLRGGLGPNLLVIRISPVEGMYFLLNAKRPGTDGTMLPVAMEYCNNCGPDQSTPEAYERLFHDCIEGDSTFFTRWDEVIEAWELADPIERAWRSLSPEFPNYKAGSWGPQEADELLAKGGHKWWPVYGETMDERVQAIVKEVKVGVRL